MKRNTLLQWVAALVLAISVASSAASAQKVDTLSISGTFQPNHLAGTVGLDLAAVAANGDEKGWTLTLHGVSYSYDWAWWDGEIWEFITRVHATSFDFQFVGPDADILNEVVASQLTGGGLTDGVFLELRNYNDPFDHDVFFGFPHSLLVLSLRPLDIGKGVAFDAIAWEGDSLPTNEVQYPTADPQRFFSSTVISDQRPGNAGSLSSLYDLVDIGSSAPPSLPARLSIANGSVLEGAKGTSRLDLTAKLSRASDKVATVQYATANGTAVATQDYVATSGTLTFQPGQTSRTISVEIKGDRKREPNETFSVQLSNATGATIDDGVGTATILNDD